MRLLIKDRQKGKTTGLIYTSEATGYPIVVHNRSHIEFIKEKAHELGCSIPDPVTVNELREHRCKGLHLYEHVLVDEVSFIIEDALNSYLGCKVECATMSDYLKS